MAVQVLYRGRTIGIDIDEKSKISDIKKHLEMDTKILYKDQKLIWLGKIVTEDNDFIHELSPKNNPRSFLLLGTPQEKVEKLREIESNATKEALIRSTRYSIDIKKRNRKSAPLCEYRFYDIKALAGLKDQDKALEILHTLANDPGVIAVMKKHKWKVGCLEEMYPEGAVGVDPVCVLGLNVNNGQSIKLRLRTDDLQGFRKFLTIKKTFCHELAHNVHSDHNTEFYQLMRQIERDVVELDWTMGAGINRPAAATIPEEKPVAQKLGGNDRISNVALPPNEIRARAALERISMSPDDEKVENQASVDDPSTDKTQVTSPTGHKTPDMIEECDESIEDVGNQRDINMIVELGFTHDQVVTTLEVVAYDVQAAIQFLLMGLVPGSTTQSRDQRVLIAMKKIKRIASSKKVIGSLKKIIANLCTGDEKYRRIRKSNHLFQNTIGQFPSALEFLSAVGMEEDDSGMFLHLQRNDRGLLWFAQSILDQETTN